MQRTTRNTLALALLATALGCAGGDRSSDELGLVVSQDDGVVFEGTYANALATVAFRAEFETREVTALQVSLDEGEKELSLRVFHDDHAFETQAGVALDAAEKQALAELAEVLQDVYPDGDEDLRLVTLERGVSYWAEAPIGHVIPSRSLEHERNGTEKGFGNDGVDCIDDEIGSVRRAYFDDSQGSWYVDVTVGACWQQMYGDPGNGGDYDCMGRCGGACGKWYARSGWAYDCLEHDACSFFNASSGGGSDPNCGDEYDEAQDDWWDASWVCNGPDNPLGC